MEETDNKEVSEVKTKRQAFLDKMRESNPDVNYEDDEDIFGAIDKGITDRDDKIKRNEEENKKIVDLFTKDPRSAAFFSKWAKGGDPVMQLIELFGDDFKNALDDPDKKEEFARSYTAYLDRVSKNKELEKQADDNLQATIDTLDKLQQENGWSDEEAKNIFVAANNIFQDGLLNIIKPETFIMISHALNYDTDVEEAQRIGEIQGRNAKIASKIKKDVPTDIPPTLGGGNDSGIDENPKRKVKYAFAPNGEVEI